MRPVLKRSPEERERLSAQIADRLDPVMTALGIIFLLVVLGETLADPRTAVAAGLRIATWLLWAAFVAEFVLRMVVAPSTGRFLRRHWWQLIFLLLPFLRFLRLLRALRLTRAGRVISSAVRAGRTAGRTLTSRVGWLTAVTVIVILSASQVLFELESFPDYGTALYRATITSVAGEQLGATTLLGRIVELLLIVYSVVVFATLAGILGAFFLERRRDEHAADAVAEAEVDAAAARAAGGDG